MHNPEEHEEVVLEVPASDTEQGRRSFRAALLRELYPDGLKAHQFFDALYALEVAERIRPAIVATEIRSRKTGPAIRPAPPSPPLVDLGPLSKGATALVEMITQTPRIPIERLAQQLNCKKGYVQQLVAEARRHGVLIDTSTDPKSKSVRYSLILGPMQETKAPSSPPGVQ